MKKEKKRKVYVGKIDFFIIPLLFFFFVFEKFDFVL